MIIQLKRWFKNPSHEQVISFVLIRELDSRHPAYDVFIELGHDNGEEIVLKERLPQLTTEDCLLFSDSIKECYNDATGKMHTFSSTNNEFTTIAQKVDQFNFNLTITFGEINYESIISFELLIGDKNNRQGILLNPTGGEIELHNWNLTLRDF